MCPPEPAGSQEPNRRPCVDRHAGRTTPLEIPINVEKDMGTWTVRPDPVELHDDGDSVRWNLCCLIAAFPDADFQIEFSGGPAGYDRFLGPFMSPIVRADKTLVAGTRGKVCGCYYYDVWVVMRAGGQRFKLPFPIDPQIDNLPPPPKTVAPARHPEPGEGDA